MSEKGKKTRKNMIQRCSDWWYHCYERKKKHRENRIKNETKILKYLNLQIIPISKLHYDVDDKIGQY